MIRKNTTFLILSDVMLNRILHSYKIQKLHDTLRYFFYKTWNRLEYKFKKKQTDKINLCSGDIIIPGYFNVDINYKADLIMNISKESLPFRENSAETVVCISAINYFSRHRGEEIIKEVYKILKTGGIARFGVQDLLEISRKYVNGDKDFFFQKLPDGRERFKGETMCDKINSWFYGYGHVNQEKYMYDYETLSLLFKRAGFSKVEQKKYRESVLQNIEMIDNRPDQMFFLEAIK